MKSYDILKPLKGCCYLPLFSNDTDNLEKEIIGHWVVIDRETLILPYPDSRPFNCTLNEFPTARFNEDGTTYIHYDWPRDAFHPWKLLNYGRWKSLSWQFGCHINGYVLDRNIILYYNGDIILTQCYILVNTNSIDKYKDIHSLMGHLSILQISGEFIIDKKRKEILEKQGSVRRANEYINSHPNDLYCSLISPFKTWIDLLKDFLRW